MKINKWDPLKLQTVCNNLDKEATQVPTDRLMDKEDVTHAYRSHF